MDKSTLIPFLRAELDILFIGLNPANGSNVNGHYFSVNQLFWNQLYKSGLIKTYIHKGEADHIVFGNNTYNFNGWQYRVTDLVTHIAKSNSNKVKPTIEDLKNLKADIKQYKPKVAILLHATVLKLLLRHLNKPIPETNTGLLGQLIDNIETKFFNISFPHGNAISCTDKVKQYIKVKELSWLGKLLFTGIFDGAHKLELIDNTNRTATFKQKEKFSGILVPFFKKQLENNTKKGFESMNEISKRRLNENKQYVI